MSQTTLTGVSGSVALNLDTQPVLSLDIVGNVTIANPTKTTTQKRGRLMLAASAAYTISWASAWKSTSTITLPTATVAGATIVLDYACVDGTMCPTNMFTLGLVLSNTDIAPLATLSSTGTQNGAYALANLTDGNNSTMGSYMGTLPGFVFDFGGTPRNLWKIRLGLNGGTINPLACRLAYSDNGSTWTNSNQSAISKPLDATITEHLVDNYGAHRYWALFATSGDYVQFTTVEMYPRVGG